jgi:hypothetical protein
MEQEEFFDRIRSSSPDALAREYLSAESAHIFTDEPTYQIFQDRICELVQSVESVAVVGSGNWRYSLNPCKSFREFGKHSDVDVAVVSSFQFKAIWGEMRQNEKKHYYTLSADSRERLRRNTENVYSGFISPDWIPNRSPGRMLEYKQILNTLSDRAVGFLKVKMMFFKNFDEAIDYYTRGFRAARRALR